VIDLGAHPPRIVSCDVFDTLLKRNAIAEPNRVALMAQRAASMLESEREIAVSPDALRRARMDVQRYAYRVLDILHPTGEVRFTQMMETMAAGLGYGPVEAAIFTRAEIAIELTQLAPNRPLLTWLRRIADDGIRVIAISDTWHDAATIGGLLAALAPGHPIAKVYTSADLDATKRSGYIFPLIAHEEGVTASEFLHMGDDTTADDVMPRAAGLRVQRIVPPRLVMFRRRVDGMRARARRMSAQ
jgi:predicted HAD superfamily hydrolase